MKKKLCVDLAQDFKPGETFKIDVKRVDKSFPMDTYALQRELGVRFYKQLKIYRLM